MPYYEDVTSIAVGHNNTGGLALVTSITVGGIPLERPFVFTGFSRGQTRYTPLSTAYTSGKKSKRWIQPMTLAQYTYVRDTYSGLVTAHSYLESTEEDFNAALSFKESSEYEAKDILTRDLGWGYMAIEWQFMNVVVI